jgi:thioredoxin-dependent peroxiredoxin
MALLNVGDKAPDFKVLAHTGEEVSLADFRGRYVVLWFYPKADTPGCTIEGCGLRDRADEFSQAKAQILGVSFDTVEENAAFAEKFDFPYPLLCDTERAIGVAYGAAERANASHANRISYLIDPEGVIAEVYGSVKPADHPAQLLEALAARA